MTFTTVSGSGALPVAVTTNSSSNWSQSGFASGTTYQVTPSKTSYTFAPASQNFDSTHSGAINFTSSATPVTSSITVTAPVGGVSWQTGHTQTISWAYTGNLGSAVKLDLLSGGSLSSTIASSTSIGSNGSGSYNWMIPSSLAAGSSYQVRITSTTAASCTGVSNSFTISAPAPATSSITVTYPKSGVRLPKGQYYLISWKYTGTPGNSVSIRLLKESRLYQTIAPSTSIGSNGSGYYSWRISISQASGSNFQIQVASAGNPSVTSTSGDFSIG
jgi:hypothetical protein